MSKPKKILCIICLAASFLLLAACGDSASSLFPAKTVKFQAGEVEIEGTTELTITLESGETALLDQLPELQKADFSGSACVDEIYQWAQAHPDVEVKYIITLPDGQVLSNSTESLDLSALTDSAVSDTLQALAYLPKLSDIQLGSERSDLSWDSVRAVEEACPNASVSYTFQLYGKEFSTADTTINLSHVPVDDNGAQVKQAMACMPDLVSVDMDSCGVSNEDMAAIRDAYPDVKVVWRVWFGENYSVRTDVERILASKPSVGGMIYDASVLQYCTKVKYLDLGHNDDLPSIDFVRSMPDLEVLIIAMTAVTDISPLESCPKLEYLELNSTNVADLSPLKNSTGLHHLNIAGCPNITDISPLYGLTELERLWIGIDTPVPAEQVSAMKAAVPGCSINTTVDDPHGGAWRYTGYDPEIPKYYWVPRYELLRNQLGYNYQEYSFYWLDPLCDKKAPAEFKGKYGKEVYGLQ